MVFATLSVSIVLSTLTWPEVGIGSWWVSLPLCLVDLWQHSYIVLRKKKSKWKNCVEGEKTPYVCVDQQRTTKSCFLVSLQIITLFSLIKWKALRHKVDVQQRWSAVSSFLMCVLSPPGSRCVQAFVPLSLREAPAPVPHGYDWSWHRQAPLLPLCRVQIPRSGVALLKRGLFFGFFF